MSAGKPLTQQDGERITVLQVILLILCKIASQGGLREHEDKIDRLVIFQRKKMQVYLPQKKIKITISYRHGKAGKGICVCQSGQE